MYATLRRPSEQGSTDELVLLVLEALEALHLEALEPLLEEALVLVLLAMLVALLVVAVMSAIHGRRVGAVRRLNIARRGIALRRICTAASRER